uniref:TPPP family protein n=1 Tax=Strigamia maritima TaxID=126957 RepID=T1J2B3_STRMM
MEGRGNSNMKTGQPLELLFEQFAKFGDTHKTGDSITLKNVDKWFRQALIINCKSFTSADISVTFSKLAKNKKSINYVDFLNFIDSLSDYTKANADDIKSKLRRSGAPSANNPTVVYYMNMATSDDGHSFEEEFKLFAKFGDAKSTGEGITLSNSDKWLKQAKVIDGKKITTTDTAIRFKEVSKTKKTISFSEFLIFLEKLAKMKKMEQSEFHKKLQSCGPPGLAGTTSVVKSATVGRLTDTTKYTGSSKQRFDETGKGRGKAGREEMPNKTGYVSGYQDAGTYDHTH